MHPTQLTGDRVILKQSKRDMLTPEYDPQPYTVIGVKGKRDHGEVKKRKGNQITKTPHIAKYPGTQKRRSRIGTKCTRYY